MTNLSYTGLPVLVFDTFTRFPLLRRQLVVNVPFWVVSWASAQYGSPHTCLLHIWRTRSYALTFRFVFHRTFWCSRGIYDRIPYTASWYHVHQRLRFCCDSFFTCIFLCYLRHRFETVNGTEMADVEQTQKDDSIHHVWNFSWSICLRVGFWCQCTWFWFFGSKMILSNNQSRATLWVLEPCLIVGLLSFIIILITASLSSKMYNKAFLREEFTFEEIKSTLSRSSIFPWIFFRFGDLHGSPRTWSF